MNQDLIMLLERIATALEEQNGIPKWDLIINVIPWIGVLVTIVFWLIDRHEKRRPYLEISFELVRSTMACLVIRNVGDTPAELKSMTFNQDFTEQLSQEKSKALEKKKDMKVTIFPKRYWILSLDKNIFEVIQFPQTELKIEYMYSKIGRKKRYKDETVIDFKEYGSFLVYLSEVDEFKTMTEKKLTEITKLCDDMTQYMKKTNKSDVKG